MTSERLEFGRETDLAILQELRGKAVVYRLKRDNSPSYLGIVDRVGLDQLEMNHITWDEPALHPSGQARFSRVYGTDQFSEIEVAGVSAEEQQHHYDSVSKAHGHGQ